jgi:hypothetical protein
MVMIPTFLPPELLVRRTVTEGYLPLKCHYLTDVIILCKETFVQWKKSKIIILLKLTKAEVSIGSFLEYFCLFFQSDWDTARFRQPIGGEIFEKTWQRNKARI